VTASTTPVVGEQPAVARFSLRQRLLLWLIVTLGTNAVRLLGATLHYEVSSEEGDTMDPSARPMVWAFWHQCLVVTSYQFRDHDIAVLTSLSFDGECISRIIEKFGYRAVRGSSRRGALGALLGARREIEAGRAVAFTVDGPLGPAHVAKPGPVMLARLTGAPVVAFHVGLQRAWTLHSWDSTLVPKPFSRAVARFSKPIHVPADAKDSQIEGYVAELQAALDRVRDFAETAAGK
jgi:lysophospholipid acyltransferase (LPLAT)-like uncharacterized protein